MWESGKISSIGSVGSSVSGLQWVWDPLADAISRAYDLLDFTTVCNVILIWQKVYTIAI